MSTLQVSPQTLRTAIAAGIIAVAVHLTQSRDLLVDFTRPLVMTALRLLGIDAVDRGEVMAVGDLHVPWTRDCAGINLLLILLALAVWVNRQEQHAARFWLRVLSMVPAALVANVLRVLTLIAYRTLAYPGVESPQTHYFIGLIWLVPFVAFITPRDHRPKSMGIMETLHAAAVVSLLTPMSGVPNAELITLATVMCLSLCRVRESSRVMMSLWLASGIGIAIVSMESFWLPWLLLCPMLVDFRRLRLFHLVGVLCTHSLIAMQPWAWWLAGAGIVVACLSRGEKAVSWFAKKSQRDVVGQGALVSPLERQATFFAALTLPFLASTLLSLGQETWTPPDTVESKLINQSGYEIRLRGQPAHIGLACYAAASRDRHHTVKVCLKYRGIDVESLRECPLVFTEGRHWFREFFLQDGQMQPDYATYVKSTFRPWSDPGLHLIFVSLREKQPPEAFSAACEQLAAQFYQQCIPQSAIAAK
ncbi:MAG: archaeosortase/exosortase family protein [Verrucomicrobiaceae bacterium]|nr:archaeosortase/exosortase family protein [Verrucomicrobiaceae bacterium]